MTFDLEDAKKRGCLYDGFPARIICTDRLGGFPVVALYRADGDERMVSTKADGTIASWSLSLQNLPREVTVWAGVSENGVTWLHGTEDDARTMKEAHQAKGHAAGYAPVTIKLTR